MGWLRKAKMIEYIKFQNMTWPENQIHDMTLLGIRQLYLEEHQRSFIVQEKDAAKVDKYLLDKNIVNFIKQEAKGPAYGV